MQIQPRKHVLDHTDYIYTVRTRQHELDHTYHTDHTDHAYYTGHTEHTDHTDHTEHTDHTDQEYVCPERFRSSSRVNRRSVQGAKIKPKKRQAKTQNLPYVKPISQPNSQASLT